MREGSDISAEMIIAIGSNLPDADGHRPLANCRAAVEALRGLPGCRIVAVSRWYRSAAWPPSDQPDYITGAVLLAGTLAPRALLAALQAIEAQGGRQRSVANAARTLDLDIIDYDGQVCMTADLLLPHPRAHQRGFVLRPIADILPGWRHPVSGETVQAMLAALPDAAAWAV